LIIRRSRHADRGNRAALEHCG